MKRPSPVIEATVLWPYAVQYAHQRLFRFMLRPKGNEAGTKRGVICKLTKRFMTAEENFVKIADGFTVVSGAHHAI